MQPPKLAHLTIWLQSSWKMHLFTAAGRLSKEPCSHKAAQKTRKCLNPLCVALPKYQNLKLYKQKVYLASDSDGWKGKKIKA